MRKNLLILFGVISFWSVLIGAAWAYLPLPLAAISAAVHSVGLVLTTAPLFATWADWPGRLSLPGAVNPFDFYLDRRRAWGGKSTLASQITHSGPGSNFAQGEQGQPSQRSGGGVTSESDGCAWSHDAMEMGESDLKKAGFTVVCESFPRERKAG